MPSPLFGLSSAQRKIASGLLSLALVCGSNLSDAATITLQSTAGAWTDHTLASTGPLWVGGPTAEYYVQSAYNGAGLFWGASPSGTQSGLVFSATSNGSAISLGTKIKLGALNHYNYAIYSSTALTNANLSLQLSLTSGSSSVTTGPFNFNFSIFESPNTSPCPSWQVSSVACDDKISFSAASASQQFSLGGQLYLFNLLGFSPDGSSSAPDMITTEQTATAQWLMASITAVPATPVPATPVPATPVPGPTALWLLGSGLIGLAGFSKRKRISQ